MTIRWVRGSAILFFCLFLAGVTWPGMRLGNRIFPLVLGLPLSMVWIASWVVLSFIVLLVLDRAEERARDLEASEQPGSGGGDVGPKAAGRDR